jgi:hypothetical protein
MKGMEQNGSITQEDQYCSMNPEKSVEIVWESISLVFIIRISCVNRFDERKGTKWKYHTRRSALQYEPRKIC